jgi:hypothetical protein
MELIFSSTKSYSLPLCFLLSFLVFDCYGQDEPDSVVSYWDLKHAVKHNKKIARLTYFIHSEDTIIQLFNVSVKKVGSDVLLSGNVTQLDEDKIKMYEAMRSNSNLKEFEEDERINNGNQVHIFTQELLDENRIKLNLAIAEKYVLYNKTKTSRKRVRKWVVPVLGAVGGLTVLAIIGVLLRYLIGGISA